MRHVAMCKNLVKHSKTKRTPFQMAFGQDSTELLHVRPFGCGMLYHPVTARLPPFKPRLLDGVCLGHSGGGVYKVLKADKEVLTKQVRAFEEEFPGTELIRAREKNAKNWPASGSDS